MSYSPYRMPEDESEIETLERDLRLRDWRGAMRGWSLQTSGPGWIGMAHPCLLELSRLLSFQRFLVVLRPGLWSRFSTGGHPRHIRMLTHMPAPRMVHRFGDADAWTDDRIVGRRRAVIDQSDALRTFHQIRAVQRAGDAQRLREPCGPAADMLMLSWVSACIAHGFDIPYGFDRSHQHGGSFSWFAAYDVRAPVHALGEVNVQMSARAEHRGVAPGLPAPGVSGWIIGATIGFDFDDPPGTPIVGYEDLVE